MKMPKVSVVLLTKNRRELLRKCLRSLANQTYKTFEVIVLDEYSRDGTEEMVRQIAEKQNNIIFIQRNKKGLGYGRNQGVLASQGEIIAFIDDDEEAHPDWLKNGVEAIERFQADIIRGAVYFPDGELFRELRTDKMEFPTANIFYKKKVIEDVGMFDERFIYGSEDVDLGLRAVEKGYRLEMCKESITYHCYMSKNPISILKYTWDVGRCREMNKVLRYKKHEALYNKKLILGIFCQKTHITIIFLIIGVFMSLINFFTLNYSYIYWASIIPILFSYFLFRVFVDNNFLRYPKRIIAFPYFILIDLIATLSTIKGAIKYKYFVF